MDNEIVFKNPERNTDMYWSHTQTYYPYVDFSRELVSFPDNAQTSIDIRLTFILDEHIAYVVVMRNDNDGDPRNLCIGKSRDANEITLTWEEGMDMLLAHKNPAEELPEELK